MLTKIEELRTAEQARVLAAAFADLANAAASAERCEMFLRLRDSWLLMANELQFKQSKVVRRIRLKRVRAFIVESAH